MADRIEKGVMQVETPEEKLGAYIDNFSRGLDSHPHLPPIMMRELASGGEHFPILVAHDMARIISTLTGILEEGARKGVFSEAIPFSIHAMLVGGLVFYRSTHPIRTRFSSLSREIADLPQGTSGKIAEEFKARILQAIRL
jgi:hypothetical protein